MLDSKGFRSVIHDLENNTEEFITALDRIIKLGVSIIIKKIYLLKFLNGKCMERMLI